jgi:hypothetical protein
MKVLGCFAAGVVGAVLVATAMLWIATPEGAFPEITRALIATGAALLAVVGTLWPQSERAMAAAVAAGGAVGTCAWLFVLLRSLAHFLELAAISPH